MTSLTNDNFANRRQHCRQKTTSPTNDNMAKEDDFTTQFASQLSTESVLVFSGIYGVFPATYKM